MEAGGGMNGHGGVGSGGGPEERQPVRVCVRVRPLNNHEVSLGAHQAVTPVGQDVVQTVTPAEGGRKIDRHQHQYDYVLGMHADQEDVFEHSGVGELCDQAIRGFTATVMAYGQTGSGKTHTMVGPQGGAGQLSGIIPRAGDYIYRRLEGQRVTVQASFLEIHNENVYDLLAPSPTPLPVRWSSANSNFYAESAMVVMCDTVDDLRAVIEEGVTNRSKASHLLNTDSSRSHGILTISFERENPQDPGSVTLGKINFVDLAGSERLKATQSAGQAIAETAHINKSLLALGQVVNVLSSVREQSRGRDDSRYIPYRDSKLTMILMDSLGGSCETTMIACVTPASCFVDETINTLKYASRTRAITNCPSVRVRTKGQSMDELRHIIDTLRAEILALRGCHKGAGGNGAAGGPAHDAEGMGGDDADRAGTMPRSRSNIAAPSPLDDVIARLQLENERLRAENVALKKAQYHAPPPAGDGGGGGSGDAAAEDTGSGGAAGAAGSAASARPAHGVLVFKKPMPQRRSLTSLDSGGGGAGANGGGDARSTRSAPGPGGDADPAAAGVPVNGGMRAFDGASASTPQSLMRLPSMSTPPGALPPYGSDAGNSGGSAFADAPAGSANPQSQAEMVRLLKSTLARVSLEAEELRRGECDGGSEGIAAVVRENLRLIDVLHGFDILAAGGGGSGGSGGSARRQYANPAVGLAPAGGRTSSASASSRDIQRKLTDAQQRVQELEGIVANLEVELKAVTTDPAPAGKQHILERRELRLQRDMNAMLRLDVRRLQQQLGGTASRTQHTSPPAGSTEGENGPGDANPADEIDATTAGDEPGGAHGASDDERGEGSP